MRNRLIPWLVLLVAGFPPGFIPQYVKPAGVGFVTAPVERRA
jgi:hypothetical protein